MTLMTAFTLCREACSLYEDTIKITAAYQPEADDNCENDSVGLEAKEVHWPLD